MRQLTNATRDDVHKLIRLTVCVGRGEPLLADALHHPGWAALVDAGGGDLVVGGALNGALDALRLRAAGAPDALSCPLVHPSVDDQVMEVAVGWVASGLVLAPDPIVLQSMVSQSMMMHGWKRDRARIESLIVAIAVVALHAVNG
ncbi:hypothetical protein [Microbacterium phyllosphaerae]|uniref:hypothetical protein n=1 Tax=Microbacterium phyllosphaerae TaxID=124798 RepID=UPI002167C2FE|nr:hypothetical protein [Microbacterium phyllosphaerae]MCS3442196.1 hypothetical protein [Microbacterium phyllosphaerae]